MKLQLKGSEVGAESYLISPLVSYGEVTAQWGRIKFTLRFFEDHYLNSLRPNLSKWNGPKGEFPVMAETTRKPASSTRWQFFFVASTTASTRCLVQNFQLICHSQRVNATSQYNNVAVWDVQNGRSGWDRCSGETLLAPCTRKKRLQRKITKHCHWIDVQENIGMFSKS